MLGAGVRYPSRSGATVPGDTAKWRGRGGGRVTSARNDPKDRGEAIWRARIQGSWSRLPPDYPAELLEGCLKLLYHCHPGQDGSVILGLKSDPQITDLQQTH